MADLKRAFAGEAEYVAPGDGAPFAKLWVVTKQHPNSTQLGIKRVAAYFNEKLARAHAASLER